MSDVRSLSDAVVACTLSGDTAGIAAVLSDAPALPGDDFAVSLALGDAAAGSAHLDREPGLASALTGPDAAWPPLVLLAHSRLLRVDPSHEHGFVSLAARLIAAGADPNQPRAVAADHAPMTALYGAAGVNGSVPLTRLLLDAGADPDDGAPDDMLGPEALYHAAELADPACARLVLAAMPRADRVSYCLARALDFDNLDMARAFLDAGADPNFATPFGTKDSRLVHAVRRGCRPAVVELLLESGARVDATDANGRTAFVLATRYGQERVAALLKAHGAGDDQLLGPDAFLGACARGDVAAARTMTARDPGLVESLGADDHEVLAAMAHEGRIDAVELMLDLEFPVDARGGIGTALHGAAWRGHADVVRLLLDRGADPDAINDYGGDGLDTALYGAAHCHSPNGGQTSWGTPADVTHGDYPGTVAALVDASPASRIPAGHPNPAVAKVLDEVRADR